jgi:hypothetical protein
MSGLQECRECGREYFHPALGVVKYVCPDRLPSVCRDCRSLAERWRSYIKGGEALECVQTSGIFTQSLTKLTNDSGETKIGERSID